MTGVDWVTLALDMERTVLDGEETLLVGDTTADTGAHGLILFN